MTRNRCAARVAVVITAALAVLLMHGSIASPPRMHAVATAGVPRMHAVDHQHTKAEKAVVDCDHPGCGHLCAGTAAYQSPLSPAPLVTVVTRTDQLARAGAVVTTAAVARGPPARAAPTLEELCLLRI
ncbi:DUF6153 family protein [Tsukamurella sp. 8F]|uniref:DUF6153 family protein n=1 Tax=unclassified Tsukamurella TaxID=2633480 RepID=UPI0023B88EE6|nr:MULTISPECIES: DUF6153 family protein [unclassified Tsukamurella]MDF0530765.1 DUF6153 family protein [Tsukamurella sp. 8J]MDF0587966.1 DUF6153 family protein [Tsukamurella sp. 8F]